MSDAVYIFETMRAYIDNQTLAQIRLLKELNDYGTISDEELKEEIDGVLSEHNTAHYTALRRIKEEVKNV